MKSAGGKKQVRLQDIADKVNLSVATVSRSLAGHTSISEEARAAVQKAAMDMGYVAFTHGARKPRHATRTIGVLVSAYEFHNTSSHFCWKTFTATCSNRDFMCW